MALSDLVAMWKRHWIMLLILATLTLVTSVIVVLSTTNEQYVTTVTFSVEGGKTSLYPSQEVSTKEVVKFILDYVSGNQIKNKIVENTGNQALANSSVTAVLGPSDDQVTVKVTSQNALDSSKFAHAMTPCTEDAIHERRDPAAIVSATIDQTVIAGPADWVVLLCVCAPFIPFYIAAFGAVVRNRKRRRRFVDSKMYGLQRSSSTGNRAGRFGSLVGDIGDSFRKAWNTLICSWADTKGAYLYYVAFGLFLFQYIGTMTLVSWGPLLSICKLGATALLTLKLAMQEYDKKAVVIIVVAGLFAFMSYRCSGDGRLMYVWLFVVSSQDVSLRAVALIALGIQGILLICITILATLHVVPSTYQMRGDGALRSSMGYYHPNTYAASIFAIVVSYFTMRFPHCSWIECIVVILAVGLVEIASKSRTSELLCIGTFVLAYLCSKAAGVVGLKRKVMLIFITIIALAPIVIIIYFMFFYDDNNVWQVRLNDLLSDRLLLAKSFTDQLPITLFGQDPSSMTGVSFGRYQGYVVDSGYANLLLKFGVLPCALWCIAMISVFYRSLRTNTVSMALLGLTAYSLFGAVETSFVIFVVNYSMLASGQVLFTKRRQLTKPSNYMGKHFMIKKGTSCE